MKQISKKLIAILLVFAIALPYTAYAQESNQVVTTRLSAPTVEVIVNGEVVDFSQYGVEPFIQGGRTLIPVRAVSEGMGATVSYNDKTRQITIKKGDTTIVMTLGSIYASVRKNASRRIVTMDIAPVIVQGRSLVPLRYIADAFDNYTGWDGDTYTAYIIDAEYFYSQFKMYPTKDVLVMMEQAIEFVDEDYAKKITEVKKRIANDFKTELVVISYELKIDEFAIKGDRSALTTLENQINYSSLKTSEKDFLKNIIKEAQAFVTKNIGDIAYAWVLKTEETLSREDYQVALTAIYNMPFNNSRTELQTRLNKTLTGINSSEQYKNAETKISEFEKIQTVERLSIARSAVNSLPAGIERDALKNKLDGLEVLFNIDSAEKQVKIAELSFKIEDFLSAKDQVSKLPNGSLKTALDKALSNIETEVYKRLNDRAKDLVDAVEKNITKANYDSAKLLVDLMKTSTLKKDLSTRLVVIDTVLSVEALVVKAESSMLQQDVNSAKEAIVSKIKIENIIKTLNERLAKVQVKIDDSMLNNAVKAVVRAELSQIKPDYLEAKSLVDALKVSSDKTALTNRLSALYVIVLEKFPQYAESLVRRAEELKTQESYAFALSAVMEVSDNSLKVELVERLQVVEIALKEQVRQQTIQSVEKAEASKLQKDLDEARIKVNTLESSILKTDLTTRLNALQIAINVK